MFDMKVTALWQRGVSTTYTTHVGIAEASDLRGVGRASMGSLRIRNVGRGEGPCRVLSLGAKRRGRSLRVRRATQSQPSQPQARREPWRPRKHAWCAAAVLPRTACSPSWSCSVMI